MTLPTGINEVSPWHTMALISYVGETPTVVNNAEQHKREEALPVEEVHDTLVWPEDMGAVDAPTELRKHIWQKPEVTYCGLMMQVKCFLSPSWMAPLPSWTTTLAIGLPTPSWLAMEQKLLEIASFQKVIATHFSRHRSGLMPKTCCSRWEAKLTTVSLKVAKHIQKLCSHCLSTKVPRMITSCCWSLRPRLIVWQFGFTPVALKGIQECPGVIGHMEAVGSVVVGFSKWPHVEC